MVLEEASSPQESSSTSFSESFPSNDADQYAGDRNPTVLSTRDPSYIRASRQNDPDPVYINLANLPKRWGASISGQSHPPQLVNAIVDSCEMASKMLGRPIKQEEADALAFHFAKSVRISSYGTPIGVSLGMLQAYRSMSTWRFPGWTPGEKWKAKGYPDVFGPFKGRHARLAWHMTRFNVYGFLGAMMGSIFFGSYALTVGSAGRMMDPRLRELSEKIRNRVKNGEGGELLPGKREVDVTAAPRDRETLEMARQRQRAQEGYKRNRQQKSQEQVDDMSPTGGAFGDEFIQGDDSGMMSDEQVSLNNSQRHLEELQRTSGRREESVPDQSIDDSSPMAASKPAPKQTGSAWERLRQQATSGAQAQQSQGSKSARQNANSTSNGDSFNFLQSEEDRQLARSEAQKDFDARIEREREGRDFNDQGAGRGGWRR